MNKHLILISVGPVQEFIAAARSLRDLWFGSNCLSELSKVVAASLHDQGAELIFPALQDAESMAPNSPLSVANKILSVAETDDPAETIKVVKKAWRAKWKQYADEALAEANKILGSKHIDQELFNQQISDIGEFYAVSTPFVDNYDTTRQRAEELLIARKSYRDFSAPDWNGLGRKKSSLDGKRESVFDPNRGPRPKGGLLKRGEQLDAMGLTKRFHPLGSANCPHFDDLSDIALLPWLQRVDQLDVWETVSNWENQFPEDDGLLWRKSKTACKRGSGRNNLTVQSHCFYGDLSNELHKDDPLRETAETLTRQRSMLFGKDGVGAEPDPYACIMVGDGDHMGVTLDALSKLGKDAHKSFSRHLAGFATSVEATIQKNDGRLIYSGGDDVMAYLPLHTALETAQAVHDLFHECMLDCKEIQQANIRIPSFSMGIIILHHTEPLSNAFELARQAEKTAKQEAGRDALAITLARRSGGAPITIYDKWGNDTNAFTTRLAEMGELHRTSHLPANLAYQMRTINNQCGDTLMFTKDGEGRMVPQNAASALALRVISHKDTLHGHNHETALVASVLQPANAVRQLSDELIIARVFAKAWQLSTPSTEEQS